IAHPRLALHGIQNGLRAALGADPQPVAAHFGQRVDNLLIEPVGAADAFKGQTDAPLLQLPGIALEPAVSDGQNIVSVPQLVWVVALLNPGDFIGDVLWRATAVRVAEDGMAAPGAGIGAAAGRNQGDRAGAVVRFPGVQIALHGYSLAVGPGLGAKLL